MIPGRLIWLAELHLRSRLKIAGCLVKVLEAEVKYFPQLFSSLASMKSWDGGTFIFYISFHSKCRHSMVWRHAQTVWDSTASYKIDYVIVINNFLNPGGHQNPISGSKVTWKPPLLDEMTSFLTKGDCSGHPQPLLGKVKTAGQGCGLPAFSGGSLERQRKPNHRMSVLAIKWNIWI